MRTTQNPAAAAQPMPFEGLGFSAAPVRAAAREMEPIPGGRRRETFPFIPVPVRAPARTGGYQLLVAQGREIRGR